MHISVYERTRKDVTGASVSSGLSVQWPIGAIAEVEPLIGTTLA